MDTQCDSAETGRMQAVDRYRILDSEPEPAFDRIARIAARCFGAQAASVTITDSDRIWFKASHGLGGVQEISRDPGPWSAAILDGAAGVVRDAATDPRTARQPLVVGELQVRFCAAAPIVTADGYRIGTVNVLDTRPHDPTEDDMATLTDLAAIAMEQLERRLSVVASVASERNLRDAAEHDRDSAERDKETIEDYAAVLQRTLLPPSLPRVPGLSLAAHYHPASPRQVGGDFYDVFAIGQGRWAFFVGDVEGHGAVAATVTSLIRYTLRAAALHYDDPTEGLAELNAVLVSDPNQHRFCTVLFGVLEPDPDGDGFQITLATGGHPPALLLAPESDQVTQVRSEGGMLVGAIADATFDSCRLLLRRGQTLLLYTDGIIEARPDGTEGFGEEGLAAFLAGNIDLPAARLVSELAQLIPGLVPEDDIALLALTADREPEPTA
jgi:phosphoserine phosphatase RsbU/P